MIMDCEGINLGTRGGTLEIMSICVDDMVYIVDVKDIRFKNLKKYGFKEILENSEYKKVIYCCRMDYSALLHEHNCNLSGIVDLQMVDITLQEIRYEKREYCDHIVANYLNRKSVHIERSFYEHIFLIKGLFECMKVRGVRLYENYDKHTINYDEWGQRPIKKYLLKYAVNDIICITRLYKHFVDTNIIKKHHDKILNLSMLFAMTLHANHPNKSDAHLTNLLPVNILNHISTTRFNSFCCIGCHLDIPNMYNVNRNGYCLVCYIVYYKSIQKALNKIKN